MALNTTLKFSWGHIITAITTIVISFCTFIGLFCLTEGDSTFSLIGTIVISSLLVVIFIGLQSIKSTDNKFDKKIVVERIILLLSPLFFLLLLIPTFHSWAIFSKRNIIESNVERTIQSAKDIFNDYEKYVNDRIDKYNPQGRAYEKENKKEALRIQLKGENYKEIKNKAFEWLDNVANSDIKKILAISNTNKLKDGIENWERDLKKISQHRMSDEDNAVKSQFSSNTRITIKEIEKINKTFTSWRLSASRLLHWIIAVILYLLLLLPYLLQARNNKARYIKLIPSIGKNTTTKNKNSNNNDTTTYL
ncbi:MAG: hypothetical protein IKA04_01995 [Alistipes sp.]|nr:hypothetical protein [Alistipes sp.]